MQSQLRHTIHCKLKLDSEPTITDLQSVQNCSCYNVESCDAGAWSYWSDCNGQCKQTRVRKGFFYFHIFWFNVTFFIKTCLKRMNPFREIKVNQIKKMGSVNVQSCVFMMFQMISIWN